MRTFITLSIIMVLSSCLYTRNAAISKFGCKTDSTTVDSIVTQHSTDTFYSTIYLPADTVKVQSPCAELAKLKPGESQTHKGKRTSLTLGKDSSGKEYISCLAEEYKDSMEWYRQNWKQTVYQTAHKHQPVVPAWYVEYWWVIAIIVSLFIIWLFRG